MSYFASVLNCHIFRLSAVLYVGRNRKCNLTFQLKEEDLLRGYEEHAKEANALFDAAFKP